MDPRWSRLAMVLMPVSMMCGALPVCSISEWAAEQG
jgi:hypothetical protein